MTKTICKYTEIKARCQERGVRSYLNLGHRVGSLWPTAVRLSFYISDQVLVCFNQVLLEENVRSPPLISDNTFGALLASGSIQHVE